MVMIKELVKENLIKLELNAATKAEALVEIAELLDEEGMVGDKTMLIAALNEREATGSTGIGFGIAIPHAKTDEVKEACLFIGLKKEGIDWDSLDKLHAHLIIAVLVPASGGVQEHLMILQKLSRKLVDQDFRSALLQAVTRKEMIELLETIA